MKNQILLFVTMIFVLEGCKSNENATPVFFKGLDPSFEQFLVDKKIDSDRRINGQMLVSDAKGIDSLYLVEMSIKSLAGIENFTDLRVLDCSINLISSIDLSQCPKLEKFDCVYSLLTTLDVSKNTKLKHLRVWANYLTDLDVKNNINLEDFSCSNNQLTALDITKNINLKKLACTDNRLSNLDVSKASVLKELYCNNNKLSSLDVSKNVNLLYLNCFNNNIATICVNDVNKAKNNNTSFDTDGIVYWQKDQSSVFSLCK